MAGGKSLVTQIKERRRDEVKELLLRYVTSPVLHPSSELALDAQNDKGDGTALLWASICDWPEVIHLLLELGACPDIPSRSGSLTPLHAACDHNASPDTIR
jgi:ankyrin repeat protein